MKSLITAPREGFAAPAGRPLEVRGHAWSGHVPVAAVDVSTDGGASWRAATLAPPAHRFAWRRFALTVTEPPAGAIEIVARARDADGRLQPLQCAPWNPRGYCNNMVHRVHGRIG